MLYRGYTARHCVATIIFPTLQVPKVTNINFLLTISILWTRENVKRINQLNTKGRALWSVNKFHKEKYGSQCGEFVCGYWSLKGQLSLTYRLHFDDHPFIWLCLKWRLYNPQTFTHSCDFYAYFIIGLPVAKPNQCARCMTHKAFCVLFVFHDDHLVFSR